MSHSGRMGRDKRGLGANASAAVHDRAEARLHFREVRPHYFRRNEAALRIAITRSYRLVPMGSFSRIERTTGDKATYELYGSGDLHFGRLLHNRRFDFAMVAFLDCLKQLMDYVKSQDSLADFPHQ